MSGDRVYHFSSGRNPERGRLVWECGEKCLEGTYTESPGELDFQQLELDLYLILRPGQRWSDGPCLSRMVCRIVPDESYAMMSFEDWEDQSRFFTDHGRAPLIDWRDGKRIGLKIGGQFTLAYSWSIVAQPAWGPIIAQPTVHELYVVNVPRQQCICSEGADVLNCHGDLMSRGYTYFVSR